MAAYDNAEMPRAPTQYGPPLANFGAQIASLPDSYYQGAQQRREYDQARAFENGIPMKDGRPDTDAMTATVLKFGGTQAAAGLIPSMMSRDIASNAPPDFQNPLSPQQPQQPRPTAPVFAPPPQQPRPPVASPDQGNNGGDTVRNIMAGMFGDKDVQASMPGMAQRIGAAGVDVPLTPQQAAQLKQQLGPGQSRMQPQPAPQQQPQPSPQQPAPPPQNAMPAGTPADYTEENVRKLEDAALRLRGQAAKFSAGGRPDLSKAYENQAATFDAKAKQISEALAKNVELTPGMKDARASGIANPVELKKVEEQNKNNITEYGKLYTGLSSAGTTSAQMLPNIQLAKGLINDPQFYSGSAEALNLGYKRILSSLGIEPGASLPQEAFRKVMASTILHQVDDMKASATEMGSSSSRIFASQIELMEKAAQNPDNTVEANKFLTELSERAADRNMKIATMAADYKIKHGGLDAQFEKDMREWMVKNPMFTKAELANTKAIGQTPAPGQKAPAASDGATATNPQTGQQLIRKNGKWVPVI